MIDSTPCSTVGGERLLRGGFRSNWSKWSKGFTREKYFDFNVKHFHEKLTEEHGIGVIYTLTKQSRSVSEPIKSEDSVKPVKPIKKPKAKAAEVGRKVNSPSCQSTNRTYNVLKKADIFMCY